MGARGRCAGSLNCALAYVLEAVELARRRIASRAPLPNRFWLECHVAGEASEENQECQLVGDLFTFGLSYSPGRELGEMSGSGRTREDLIKFWI